MFFRLLLLALSLVSAAAGSSTTVEPTIVHILVTSTVTAIPTYTIGAVQPIQARQWQPSPAPSWSEPAWSQPPVWTEPAVSWTQSAWTQPAWTQPVWTPTTSIAPTATATAAPTPSPSLTYEETHRPNPKDTKNNKIVALVVFGGFFALAIIFGLLACVVRRCSSWKKPSKEQDVEMTAGLRPGTGATSGTVATGGARSTMGSVEEYAPQRPRSVLDPLTFANPNRQPVHWPQGEISSQTVRPQPGHTRWSRDGGYQPTG